MGGGANVAEAVARAICGCAPDTVRFVTASTCENCSPRPVENHEIQRFKNAATDHFDVVVSIDSESEKLCAALPGAPPVVCWGMAIPGEDDEKAVAEFGGEIARLARDLFDRGYFRSFVSRRRFFSSILDNLKDGIIVHDNDRLIMYINGPAIEITGYSKDEVVGAYCQDIFPGGFCGGKCDRSSGWSRSCPNSYTIDFRTKGGALKQLEMSIINMTNDQGERTGVIASFRDRTKMYELEKKLGSVEGYEGIVGRDHAMIKIFDTIRDLSGSAVATLVQGETGSGKELVAGAIHNVSGREGLFVPVNCGALPEGIIESELFGHVKGAFTGAIRDKMGRFEMARGGTVFLDEVGELPQSAQVKLLRVLQEGTFERVGGEQTIKADVRVISATNRDLRAMMQEGKFREDLYYRLCVVPITLPPLRDRKNDIPLLAGLFVERYAPEKFKGRAELSQDCIERLLDYNWPGNVRQLQNAIQYALVKTKDGLVGPEHLPPEILEYFTVRRTGGQPGRKLLLTEDITIDALRRAGGNKAKAARLLGVGRATLYRFLESKGISI